ncbi:MAG: ParB/RepB/Spo0J family partition protein [Alphaproteobacteria bacterium]|nr:ParB/RepB/Spo0J family partition protein [Alphaproteobacteria bacterium]
MVKPKLKTKPAATLCLSASRDIPLNKLILSQSNVRQVKAGVSIEELAEDIARRTLLQSLTVRAVLDETGAETGMYEVPAGGRRFRALQMLVDQKRLAPDAPIPCVIRTEGLAEEDSLAENIQRAPLHPLDQFRAFQTLREKGKSEAEIAAAFFVTPMVVKQRLKLAAIAPALLDLYADDAMTLEQLMTFTVNGDHLRQCQVWEALKNGYNREPYHIRRLLTEGAVRAGDKRARFVGVEAYEEAGGVILRDLFSDADDGWLQDAGLLGRLVAEKLESCAAEIRGEGWKWVEVAVDFPYGHTFGLRRHTGEQSALTEAEQSTYDSLKAEYDALQEGHEGTEELSDEVDRRLGELEAGIEAFEQRPWRFPAEEVDRAGAFVSLDPSGALRIERGFVKPEDESPAEEEVASEEGAAAHADDDGSHDAASTCVDDESDDATDEPDRPIPDRLLIELTEWRTLALRDAVAKRPDIAFVAALHALCLNLFYQRGQHSCIDIAARQSVLRSGAAGLSDCAAAASIDARHQDFAGALPADPSTLWQHLTAMEDGDRIALFAHCVALSVDAVFRPYDRRSGSVTHADQLASAIGLDLHAAGWRPSADAYFGRITKAQILEAVCEAKGEEAADRIASLKKPEMAKAAEDLLEYCDWLPKVLRTSEPSVSESLAAEDASPAGSDLPACPAIAAE